MLKMDLNYGGHLKSVEGSKYSKAGSPANNASSKNTKFADIYEQVLALPQTTVLENIVKQTGKKKTLKQTFELTGERQLLPIVLKQRAGPDNKNSKIIKNQTNLISKRLSKQANYTGQTISLMEQKNAAAAERPGISGKRVSNETIKLTGNEAKLVKAAEQKSGQAAKAIFSQRTAKPISNETIKLTGNEAKLIKAAEQKGSQAAQTIVSQRTAKPISNETIKLTGNESKLIKAAEQKSSPAAQTIFSQRTAKPISNETIKLTGNESKLIKAAEQKGSQAAQTIVSQRTIKSISNETIKLTGDDFKLFKAGEHKGSQATEAIVPQNAAKPIKETNKLTGNEFKIIKAAEHKGIEAAEVKSIKPEVKGGHLGEAQDIPGEVNRFQPAINKSQVMVKTESDNSIMSKSQMDSIVANLAGQIKSGASSLEMNLKPEYLGKIKLLLQMNEGSLSIRIIAQTGETLNLLNANLQNIQESLEQQGIKLNGMIVDLANQEKQGNQTGSRYREESKTGNFFRESKESYDNTGGWEQNSSYSNRLNILA